MRRKAAVSRAPFGTYLGPASCSLPVVILGSPMLRTVLTLYLLGSYYPQVSMRSASSAFVYAQVDSRRAPAGQYFLPYGICAELQYARQPHSAIGTGLGRQQPYRYRLGRRGTHAATICPLQIFLIFFLLTPQVLSVSDVL